MYLTVSVRHKLERHLFRIVMANFSTIVYDVVAYVLITSINHYMRGIREDRYKTIGSPIISIIHTFFQFQIYWRFWECIALIGHTQRIGDYDADTVTSIESIQTKWSEMKMSLKLKSKSNRIRHISNRYGIHYSTDCVSVFGFSESRNTQKKSSAGDRPLSPWHIHRWILWIDEEITPFNCMCGVSMQFTCWLQWSVRLVYIRSVSPSLFHPDLINSIEINSI